MQYSVVHLAYSFSEEWEQDLLEQSLCDIGFEVFDGADAYATTITIDYFAILIEYTHIEAVESRGVGAPELGLSYTYLARVVHSCATLDCDAALALCYGLILGILELVVESTLEGRAVGIANVSLEQYICRGFAHLVVGHEKTTSCHDILVVGVGDKYLVVCHQPAVTIDAAKVGVVECALRLARRVCLVVAIVRPYGNDVLALPIYGICDINHNRQIASEVLGQLLTVYEYTALAHDGLEVQK